MGLFSALFGGGPDYSKEIKENTQEAKANASNYEAEGKLLWSRLMRQYENGTDSASQAALAQERQLLKENLEDTEARAAVTGASASAQRAARSAASKQIGETTRAIAANNTANTQNAMANYVTVAQNAMAAKNGALANMNNSLTQQAAAETQASGALLGSVIGAGASLGAAALKK